MSRPEQPCGAGAAFGDVAGGGVPMSRCVVIERVTSPERVDLGCSSLIIKNNYKRSKVITRDQK